MKIDELLKRLENVKTDEDEKRKITEYLAKIFSNGDPLYTFYIMTKDRKIYDIGSYEKLLKSNKISPNDAYVYVEDKYIIGYNPSSYFYPFLIDRYLLPFAYLSKLGFNSLEAVPTLGLKYVSMVIHFNDFGRIVVEVADIDTITTNTNLPTIVRNVLSTKDNLSTIIRDILGIKYYVDNSEVENIASQLDSQKLFAGHDFDEARDIINRYYAFQEISLAKEVEDIRDAYDYIFKPYRVVYDLKTKQFIPA